jgi:transcriptional regulator with XRE-family HTH domain
MMDSKEFGRYMEKLRLEAGFNTQASLSKASGVWASTIKRIEDGDTKTPNFETLKKMAPHLKVPYAQLLKVAGFLDPAKDAKGNPIGFDSADNVNTESISNEDAELVAFMRRAGTTLTPEEKRDLLDLAKIFLKQVEEKRRRK